MRDLLPALMLEQERLNSARLRTSRRRVLPLILSTVAELLETGSLAGRMIADRTLPHPLVLNE